MRRNKSQKASEKLSLQIWDSMWHAACPWVCSAEFTKLQPIVIPAKNRSGKMRNFIGAMMMVTSLLMTTQSSEAAREDINAKSNDNIILASLNTRNVPGDSGEKYPGLFGTGEQRYGDISAFTKWTGVLSRFRHDFRASLDQPKVQNWMSFLSSLGNASKAQKIAAVNEYMNKVKFVADTDNYGSNDYWATPIEFLTRGGDCEDYAIAKYISLRALGFTQNDMRLVIVYDRVMRMPHALLVVYNEGEAKVLDNQNPAVMDSAEISRYKPIYSISQVAWWRH